VPELWCLGKRRGDDGRQSGQGMLGGGCRDHLPGLTWHSVSGPDPPWRSPKGFFFSELAAQGAPHPSLPCEGTRLPGDPRNARLRSRAAATPPDTSPGPGVLGEVPELDPGERAAWQTLLWTGAQICSPQVSSEQAEGSGW